MTETKGQEGFKTFEGWLFDQSDWPLLALDGAVDDEARLCRAWLVQHCPNHPDHNASKSLLLNTGPNAVNDLITTSLLKLRIPKTENITPWQIFCPSAAAASTDPASMSVDIQTRRQLHRISPPEVPIENVSRELLFTTNALLSPPLDPHSEHIPLSLRQAARHFESTPQSFWYDHPVPLDASPEENEILYGLSKLDDALAREVDIGVLARGARLDIAMSISVTHEGMEDLASRYVIDQINNHLQLRHLRVFLFDEKRCKQIVKHLCPSNAAAADVFGVNGSYGRHYSFLKAIVLLWQMSVNPHARFSFKIDLDQVFDQDALLAHTGRTALQLISNPLWGGDAVDYDGRSVDLSMLAGALVNQRDISNGLYSPDVNRPESDLIAGSLSSLRLFCPQWPQAISTESEILQKRDGFQRIHVTGGTTGITADALLRWQPFTPSFINRAEDQAYALSTFRDDKYLAHLHAEGLIMRHDKQLFAARAIAHAKSGKAIGDIERLLLFSRYSELHNCGMQKVRDHFWPFTSCFVHPDSTALAGLIFALDGAAKGGRFVTEGAPRLLRCMNFCSRGMEKQLEHEKDGWQAIYTSLSNSRHNASGLQAIVTGGQVAV